MNSAKIWELSDRVGGIFKLTVLLQKRVQELIRGANKLVETESRDVLAIALMEVEQNKISLELLSKEELEAGARDAQDEMAAQRSIHSDGKVSKDLGIT